jgi:hypothetical protein
MQRPLTLVVCALLLSGCAWDRQDPEPCGDCPEYRAQLSVACQDCDPAEPLVVRIQNNQDETIVTDLCSWELFGIRDQRHEEAIQRPDCTLVDPMPLAFPGGATGELTVELDPATLPDLTPYSRFFVRVSFWWGDGDKGGAAEIQSGFFTLTTP